MNSLKRYQANLNSRVKEDLKELDYISKLLKLNNEYLNQASLVHLNGISKKELWINVKTSNVKTSNVELLTEILKLSEPFKIIYWTDGFRHHEPMTPSKSKLHKHVLSNNSSVTVNNPLFLYQNNTVVFYARLKTKGFPIIRFSFELHNREYNNMGLCLYDIDQYKTIDKVIKRMMEYSVL